MSAKRILTFILIIILLSLLSIYYPQLTGNVISEDNHVLERENATLLRVVDGDTLDLEIDLGMSVSVKERVRLIGINTPETFGVKQDSAEYQAGTIARKELDALFDLTRTVTFYVVVETFKDRKEKYGRYLANVYAVGDLTGNWVCINDKMKELGYGV